MNDIILDGIHADHSLSFERNNDYDIECGCFVYRLFKDDKVILYTMTDDLTPFEQYFAGTPLEEIRKQQGIEYPY